MSIVISFLNNAGSFNRDIPSSCKRSTSECGDTATEENVNYIEDSNSVGDAAECLVGVDSEIEEKDREFEEESAEEVGYLTSEIEL